MKHRLLLLLCVLASSLCARAQTATATMPGTKLPAPFYLALTPAQELALIPPVPAKGSAQDQQDLAGVLQIQAARTPAQIAEALRDKTYTISLVTSVLGANFTAQNDPVTFALLTNASKDISSITGYLKNYYQRNRPYVDHPEVKNLFTDKSMSYPSGHASGSEAIADILSLLFPDQQAALHARAQTIAASRVIAGVHYPTDIQQGAVLGDKVAALLEANPAFQKDLAAAKAELPH